MIKRLVYAKRDAIHQGSNVILFVMSLHNVGNGVSSSGVDQDMVTTCDWGSMNEGAGCYFSVGMSLSSIGISATGGTASASLACWRMTPILFPLAYGRSHRWCVCSSRSGR